MGDFYTLKVGAVERLTPNAVSVSLSVPENLKIVFSFKAGQYITIKHEIDGNEVRRAYSISCAPGSSDLTVGIKKVKNGTFSLFANDNLKEGDMLEIMPPEGRFVFEPTSDSVNIAAFAAGSGITPIMGIAETVLSSNAANTFVLVFGNQSPEEVMYSEKLKALQDKYADRFFIQYIFSREKGNDDALFGRIDGAITNFVLKNKFKGTVFDNYYLCGPEEMIETVKNTLIKNGVSEKAILFELFTTDETDNTLAETLEGHTAIEVVLEDETFSFTMDQRLIILDEVLKKDIDAPYSCQGGVCSSCIARVIEGKAKMVKNQILTDSEIEEGLILTCQSHPTTPTLKIDYDDV